MTPAKRPSTRARQTPIQSLDDLQPDPLNANRGTDRGREALRRSLHTYGAGRSIVIDKRGRILGGAQDRGTGQAPGAPDHGGAHHRPRTRCGAAGRPGSLLTLGECPTGSRKSAAMVNTSYPTFCISAMLSSSRSRCAFSIQRCS